MMTIEERLETCRAHIQKTLDAGAERGETWTVYESNGMHIRLSTLGTIGYDYPLTEKTVGDLPKVVLGMRKYVEAEKKKTELNTELFVEACEAGMKNAATKSGR